VPSKNCVTLTTVGSRLFSDKTSLRYCVSSAGGIEIVSLPSHIVQEKHVACGAEADVVVVVVVFKREL